MHTNPALYIFMTLARMVLPCLPFHMLTHAYLFRLMRVWMLETLEDPSLTAVDAWWVRAEC